VRLKAVLLIFLIVAFLDSCTTFKPLIGKHRQLVGVFNANYSGKTFEGFFSIADQDMRLDVVNSLGFSAYGVYVKKGDVYLVDYSTGRRYKNLTFGGMNLNGYKKILVSLVDNFYTLCKTKHKNIFILRCMHLKDYYLPVDFILFDRNKRMRIHIKKLKFKENEQ